MIARDRRWRRSEFEDVTARGADLVFVVDAAEWKVLKTFPGHHPHGLAIFPGR